MVKRSDVRIGKKCNRSDFDHGMIASQKWLISCDFHTQQFLEFAENGAKN